MSKVTDLVTALILPVIGQMGVELWDVEFVRIGGEQYLRILIDSENGIFVDQCEAVSKAVDPLLDQSDIIDTAYLLEVASAGIERTLKKPEHFIRYVGSLIELRLFKAVDGQKRFVGILESYEESALTLKTTDATLTFPLDNISKASLKYNWQ